MTPTAPPAYDTLADAVRALGDVPLHRVLWHPAPGTATEEDHLRLVAQRRRVELVDGVLVEKPMGAREAYLAFTLMGFLWQYQRTRNIGVLGAPDSNMRLRAGLVRLPDVHFTRWERLAGDAAHLRPVVDYPPDLAVEILPESDRPGMVARKVREYFAAGTQAVWVVDPLARTAEVYDDPRRPDRATLLRDTDALTGGTVLPGFALQLSDLFNDPQLNPRPTGA